MIIVLRDSAAILTELIAHRKARLPLLNYERPPLGAELIRLIAAHVEIKHTETRPLKYISHCCRSSYRFANCIQYIRIIIILEQRPRRRKCFRIRCKAVTE